MPNWFLIVVADQEYRIDAGPDEAKALTFLAEAKENIGMNGTVTIANRLALDASRIVSVRIEKHKSGAASF